MLSLALTRRASTLCTRAPLHRRRRFSSAARSSGRADECLDKRYGCIRDLHEVRHQLIPPLTLAAEGRCVQATGLFRCSLPGLRIPSISLQPLGHGRRPFRHPVDGLRCRCCCRDLDRPWATGAAFAHIRARNNQARLTTNPLRRVSCFCRRPLRSVLRHVGDRRLMAELGRRWAATKRSATGSGPCDWLRPTLSRLRRVSRSGRSAPVREHLRAADCEHGGASRSNCRLSLHRLHSSGA